MTEAYMSITLDGREIELTILARAQRNMIGGVEFHSVVALDEQRHDHWPFLSEQKQAAARTRLWCAHISETHPLGEPEAAV